MEETESQLNQVTRAKQQLQTQLEEAKVNLEDESRVNELIIIDEIFKDILG